MHHGAMVALRTALLCDPVRQCLVIALPKEEALLLLTAVGNVSVPGCRGSLELTMQLYKCFREVFFCSLVCIRWLEIDASAPWIRDALGHAFYRLALGDVPPRLHNWVPAKEAAAHVLRTVTKEPCLSLIRAYGYLASDEHNSYKYECQDWVHNQLITLPPASPLLDANGP